MDRPQVIVDDLSGIARAALHRAVDKRCPELAPQDMVPLGLMPWPRCDVSAGQAHLTHRHTRRIRKGTNIRWTWR